MYHDRIQPINEIIAITGVQQLLFPVYFVLNVYGLCNINVYGLCNMNVYGLCNAYW